MLGTPDESIWPTLKDMPDYTANYPIYPRQDLLQLIPKIERQGVDLLERMLEYDPEKRILASEALLRTFNGNCRWLLCQFEFVDYFYANTITLYILICLNRIQPILPVIFSYWICFNQFLGIIFEQFNIKCRVG